MVKKICLILFIVIALLKLSTQKAYAQVVTNIQPNASSIRVYEKYEVKFNVSTASQYPFFAYDENPPPGVTPKVGITVEGIFQTPSGEKRQPAFYMTEVTRSGSEDNLVFEETNKKYWVVRFSPQEQGTYQVSIHVKDSSGETTQPVTTSFNATTPTKKGFIKVSQKDNRYFEFSNGDIYWPIGPAWSENQSANSNSRNYDYSQYKDTGQNLERPWLGGIGAYSTNWARWKSSGEAHGNEGIMTRLTWKEKYPGHDLSYEIFDGITYKDLNAHRMWLTTWMDDMFGPRLKSGQKYYVKLTYKSANINGPRNSGPFYGFVVKTSDYVPWGDPQPDAFDSSMRGSGTQIIVPYVTTANDWRTYTGTFTPMADRQNIYLYLDNVTAGQAYVDEFSMKPCLNADCSSLGGEVIRNPRADEHTYVEQRPAAFLDWQVEQGEQNGVYFKYVVHDKNDWIPNHLLDNGTWADQGHGYNPPYNTKARWLLRQWYRYLIARWGYSTAIFAWEMVNEEDPNNSAHWSAAQDFAKFMHDNDAHPHLASTSFWCCWRDELSLWQNSALYPDIGYADIHEYTGNPQVVGGSYAYDMAGWIGELGRVVFNDHVGKPVLLGEAGITVAGGWEAIADLQKSNSGVWYHNLIWAGLHYGAVTAPNYWFSEHFRYINREQISKPFFDFVKTLDLNKGGFVDSQATAANTNLRTFGQKNLAKGEAYLWIQNKNHTWKNVMDNPGGNYQLSGNISVKLNPNTGYKVDWGDTNNGGVVKTQNINSGNDGNLVFSADGFTGDVAVKITSGYVELTPTPTPIAKLGDVNGDSLVNSADLLPVFRSWLGTGNCSGFNCNLNGDNKVNSFDTALVIANWGK